MIDLLIFYLHTIAGTAVFTKRYQEEGLGEGFLGLAFFALIFFVGWGMASFVAKLMMGPEGLGTVFNRDTAGLTLLTLGEGIFYYFYFRPDGTREKGTNGTVSGGGS
jgi:hypothetical protein